MTQIIINADDITAKRIASIANKSKSGNGMLEALNKAMMIEKLTEKLNKGIAHFTYRKVSGEIREAWGTNLKELCAKHLSGKGGSHSGNYETLSYFDIERGNFRCFRWENIIAVAD